MKCAAGFALISVPTEYGNSGMMTFIVSREEMVFETDLDPDKTRLAVDVAALDTDPTWNEVQ